MQPRDFHEKCRQQQNFDSDPKEAWHYNHVTKICVIHAICSQNKGGDTRELQSRMVPSQNNWVESP